MRRALDVWPLAAVLAVSVAAPVFAQARSDQVGTVAEWQARTSVAQEWLEGRYVGSPATRVTYDGPPIVIRFSAHNPANASVVRDVFLPAFETLRRMSGGKLIVRPSWEGSSHPLSEGWTSLARGDTDITACYASLEAEKRGFRLLTLLDLPGLFPNAAVATAVSERLYARWFRADFERNGVLIGRMKATGPSQLYLRARPGEGQGLAGLNVASADGAQAAVLAAIGARPALLPSPDVRSALLNGRLQGVAITDAAAQVYGVAAVAPYALEGDLGRTNLEYCISPGFHAKLPADLRIVLNAWLRAEAQAEAQVFYGREGARAREAYAMADGARVPVTAATSRRWRAASARVERDMVAQLESSGLPAAKFMREVRRLTARYVRSSDNDLMREAIGHPLTDMTE